MKRLKRIMVCIISTALVLTMLTGMTFAEKPEEGYITYKGMTVEAKGTIKVGHLLDLTGSEKPTGDAAHEAFTFACDYVQKTTGWTIEVVEGDCQSDADKASFQAEQMIEQGCQVIFGPNGIGHKKAVLAYVADNNIPVVLYNGSPLAFTGGFLFDNDMIVALGGGTASFPTVMADYIFNDLGYRTVFCFKPETVYGNNYVDPFVTCFEGMGGEVVDNFAVPQGTNDWSEYLAAMINSDAEAIVGWTYPTDAVAFFNEWYNSGAYRKLPVFATAHEGFSDSNVMDALDSKIVDALIEKGFCAPICWAYSVENDYNKDYVAAYTDSVEHRPIGSNLAGSCCQALLCLTTALDNLGVTDPTTLSTADLADAMRAAEFDGPEGHTVFEGDTVVATKDVYVAETVKLDDGSYNYEVQKTYEQVSPDGYNYDLQNGVYLGGQHADGWIKDKLGFWHYYENNVAITGWKRIRGTWYLFNSKGRMLTGWQKVGSVWYYFQGSGAMVTGWQKIGSTWYYFKSGGAMVTGWQKIGSAWYYFKSSGAMITGWQKIGGKDYFFKSSGAMAANEWVKGYWWINADGTWTYQYKGSWKQDSKGWWFGDTSGWYAKNTTIRIDGKNYKFNASGYWIQ